MTDFNVLQHQQEEVELAKSQAEEKHQKAVENSQERKEQNKASRDKHSSERKQEKQFVKDMTEATRKVRKAHDINKETALEDERTTRANARDAIAARKMQRGLIREEGKTARRPHWNDISVSNSKVRTSRVVAGIDKADAENIKLQTREEVKTIRTRDFKDDVVAINDQRSKNNEHSGKRAVRRAEIGKKDVEIEETRSVGRGIRRERVGIAGETHRALLDEKDSRYEISKDIKHTGVKIKNEKIQQGTDNYRYRSQQRVEDSKLRTTKKGFDAKKKETDLDVAVIRTEENRINNDIKASNNNRDRKIKAEDYAQEEIAYRSKKHDARRQKEDKRREYHQVDHANTQQIEDKKLETLRKEADDQKLDIADEVYGIQTDRIKVGLDTESAKLAEKRGKTAEGYKREVIEAGDKIVQEELGYEQDLRGYNEQNYNSTENVRDEILETDKLQTMYDINREVAVDLERSKTDRLAAEYDASAEENQVARAEDLEKFKKEYEAAVRAKIKSSEVPAMSYPPETLTKTEDKTKAKSHDPIS